MSQIAHLECEMKGVVISNSRGMIADNHIEALRNRPMELLNDIAKEATVWTYYDPIVYSMCSMVRRGNVKIIVGIHSSTPGEIRREHDELAKIDAYFASLALRLPSNPHILLFIANFGGLCTADTCLKRTQRHIPTIRMVSAFVDVPGVKLTRANISDAVMCFTADMAEGNIAFSTPQCGVSRVDCVDAIRILFVLLQQLRLTRQSDGKMVVLPAKSQPNGVLEAVFMTSYFSFQFQERGGVATAPVICNTTDLPAADALSSPDGGGPSGGLSGGGPPGGPCIV